MRIAILPLTLAGLLSACATGPTVSPTAAEFPASVVTASFETPVMASEGDSADDPAIYIDADGNGFIAVTDKQAGLYIYELDGRLREFMPIGMINNVDLREGFMFDGREQVLLVASNDEVNTIEVVLYDPAANAFSRPNMPSISTGNLSPYGICLGRSDDGAFHAGLTTKAGIYEQHVLTADNGVIGAGIVRRFSTGTQSEGCVFDDRTGRVYIAEETGGLYGYDSAGEDTQTVIAKAGEYGTLADLEGVTVYEDGADGGYVIVSSQGNNSYAVFALPDLTFAGRFTIGDDVVDGVSTTDGIAATSTPTAMFPKGFLAVQDDMDDTSPSEPRKKQNIKVIDWREIEAILK